MRSIVLSVFATGLLLVLCGSSFGDVYVNMIWDEPTSSFKVKPLVLEGGVYFDRGYQNAYGEYNDLPPGPPFIIQSGILATGSVTFASGGFDPLHPFSIQINPSPGHGGAITAAQGVNFVGTLLDPIHVEGVWHINAGLDYQHGGSEMEWSYTTFDCTYSSSADNSVPIEISGLGLRADNCRIRNLSNDFFYLMSIIDFDAGSQEYNVSFQNCTFENLNFFDRMYFAIDLKNLRTVSIENCRFDNVDISEYQDGGLVYMHTCGLSSIKNNVSVHCNDSKMHMINAWAVDSAYLESSPELPIIANEIYVPPDKALAIGRGSLIKFVSMGGLNVGGRLWVDSAVFTSWEDDEYGGDTDNKPQPDPLVSNWYAHGSGIWIDTTGAAEIKNTLIRFPRSGIHACNDITLDGVTIENSWYTGVALRSPSTSVFEISNTTIRGITRSDPYPSAIFYENRSAFPQELRLTNVNLENNEHNGVQVFYLQDAPTTIELRNCRIANNGGYGIIFPIDNALTSIDILHSVFVGNYYTAIRGTDAYGVGVPIRIENNVVIGNGLNDYGSQPYGIHLSGGEARITGNTVVNNGETGILVGGLDNIDQCVVANNLIAGHTEYGLYKSDYGAPIVVGNDHWDNGDETQELRYRGPDGWIYTIEDLQALGGNFVTNVNFDPGMVPGIFGEIDSLGYDSRSGRSKLIDTSAGFTPQMIAGRVICPDTAGPRWYPIDSVSGDTLIILGDISDHAGTGSVYRLLNYHITETSQLIDAGFTSQTTATLDIDGDDRVLDGDENGSMLVDIGADEFKGEDASSPMRVLEPSIEKLLVAYGTFNIEWKVPDSVASVDIAYNSVYDPANPDFGWETIASGTDATSNYYSWQVPAHETTAECYVRVTSSAHPGLVGMSAPFKIKHTELTRIRNDSLIAYFHTDDSWQFPNDSANMWPVEAWPDYLSDPDPYTGFYYPLEFADLRTNNRDFPSWPTFVEAFGVDACYFNTWNGYLYRPAAVLRWGAIKHDWNGSCLGLAVTNLMAFVDSAAFADRPEIGPFINLNSLGMTDQRRRMINRYYAYQFGKANRDHTVTARTKTPSETLAELRSMFSSMVASKADRVITICDTSSVNNRGCHTVTPYFLERVNQQDNTWSLLVYDNNVPNDFPTIDFNANTNSWTYAQLGLSGDRLFFLEDPLSNYADPAIMTEAPKEPHPVATATSDYLEIYLTNADSVRLELGTGAIGQYHDSLFNTVPEAMPIIPRADDSGDPIGYLVPEGNWSCRLAGVTQGQAHVSVFSDSVIMSYRRNGAVSTEVDRVDIRRGAAMHLLNPDATGRDCDIDFVLVAPDRERVLALDNLVLTASDSGTVEVTQATGLRVTNYGSESTYDIALQDVSSSGLREFTCENVTLEANSVHQLEPDWVDLNREDLMIVIDLGINGVFEDTIFIANNSPTDVDDAQSGADLPYQFDLLQNYPNPFNPVTTIEYSLPRRSHVSIEIFNVLGQIVRTLLDREESAGSYTINWDGTTTGGQSVATGVYFYRFQAGDYVETKKMLLLK